MKNTILTILAIVALSFGSCKKENKLTPETCNIPSTLSTVTLHLSNIGSTNQSRTDASFMLLNDAGDTLFNKKLFNIDYPSSFNFDTTININATHILLKSYVFSLYNSNGIYTIDNIADTDVSVNVDNKQVYHNYGSPQITELYIK